MLLLSIFVKCLLIFINLLHYITEVGQFSYFMRGLYMINYLINFLLFLTGNYPIDSQLLS